MIARVVCVAECEYFPARCDLDKGHGGRHSTDGHPWSEAPASTPSAPVAEVLEQRIEGRAAE